MHALYSARMVEQYRCIIPRNKRCLEPRSLLPSSTSDQGIREHTRIVSNGLTGPFMTSDYASMQRLKR